MEESFCMEEAIAEWEGEGGAPRKMGYGLRAEETISPTLGSEQNSPVVGAEEMTGTVNQIDWAKQIRARVSAEFDRVAKAFQSVADKQAGQDRIDTQAVIAILEEKRAEVMANDRAGYFIHYWQELTDQVRQMIAKDYRYQAIKESRAARLSGKKT
jgi:hypothetical protein